LRHELSFGIRQGSPKIRPEGGVWQPGFAAKLDFPALDINQACLIPLRYSLSKIKEIKKIKRAGRRHEKASVLQFAT